MRWIEKLQTRWKANSVFQVVVILTVFACTGLTVVYLMKPILKLLFGETIPAWARILYYVFILPVYNVILLGYGFIFGQFGFFWEFEKRFLNRMLSVFKTKAK